MKTILKKWRALLPVVAALSVFFTTIGFGQSTLAKDEPSAPNKKQTQQQTAESGQDGGKVTGEIQETSRPSIWRDLFIPDISIREKIIRPILVYAFLIIGLRLAGKRELAQLNPFDLVVLLTLSNTVQNAIIGADNSVSGGVIGAITLLAANYFVVRFLYNHERLDHLIEGDCDVLIKDGEILHDRLKKELLTVSQLETAAHRQGFASLADIDRAVLETGGTISFYPKDPVPELVRHTELLAKLNQLGVELTALRQSMGPGHSPA